MVKQKRRQRVNTPLDPEAHSVLDEFAQMTGKTKISICGEIITEAIPAIRQMMVAMSKMEVTPNMGLQQMAEMMHKLAFEAKQIGLELEEETQ